MKPIHQGEKKCFIFEEVPSADLFLWHGHLVLTAAVARCGFDCIDLTF